MFGISTTLLFDLIFDSHNHLAITIKSIFLAAAFLCYALRNVRFNTSAIIFTIVMLALSVTQSYFIPIGSTAILGVMLLVGFVISVLLTGKKIHFMHCVTVLTFIIMMFEQINNPMLRVGQTETDMIINYFGYCVVYFVLSYSAYYLKNKYNTLYFNLKLANQIIKDKAKENQDKAIEIEQQHSELINIHGTLNDINNDLERIVNERTDKIRRQNKILITYSNMISHQLRAPIARLKGLINVYRIEKNPDVEFYMEKIGDEAERIDDLLKATSNDINTNMDIEKDYD